MTDTDTARHVVRVECGAGRVGREINASFRYEQKRALITGRMRAVHKMASDKLALRQSALQKLNEFKRLGYPPGLLRGVCNFMGATTGEGTWIGVRNAIT